MRTDDLVHALVADNATRVASLRQVLAWTIAAAFVVSTVIFMAVLAPRPDAIESLGSIRFDLKFVETILLAVTAGTLVLRLMRPEVRGGRWLLLLLAAPIVLVLAVLAELVVLPPAGWQMATVGKNWLICLTMIPTLSVPLLIAAFYSLRYGAPTRPRLAGAVAGLFAGGIAATLYASHCIDDSPLFVATWYTLAIGFVAVVGALIGPRVLRW
jgi:hypothetical protein